MFYFRFEILQVCIITNIAKSYKYCHKAFNRPVDPLFIKQSKLYEMLIFAGWVAKILAGLTTGYSL